MIEELPRFLTELVDELSAAPGVVAVVLGGSRALDTSTEGSDWDLGLYYRGAVDLSALEARGTVYPPGTWGRLMNGGAWLRCGPARVDVLLRDLDVVEHWTERAVQGEFEVDALLGYVAGVPTYLLGYARVHAQRGNWVGTVGQVAKAIHEEAHAILCERSEWVCNEKRMIDRAGLTRLQAVQRECPADVERLVEWVDTVAVQLGTSLKNGAPWERVTG